jgi:hypothetical protein
MKLIFASLAPVLLVCTAAIAQAPKHSSGNSSGDKCGPLANNVLSCQRFAFTYKVPFGWVDRTEEMGKEEEETPPAGVSPSSPKSETLLAAFERPPGAPGETINSAAVIAAEPLANYRGVKQASDYFGPIIELAEQRGFKVENEPYKVTIGAVELVRGDFRKPRGSLSMWQSSLALIEKGYIVSFTFVGGSEDEVEELVENLRFAGRRTKPVHRGRSRPE